MSGIVCAIRGGPGSQATIDKAIALAKETTLSLHFVYVVNLDFLSYTTKTRIHTISEEMHQMGEFILLAAQSAAADQGIEAQSIVRHGNVGEEIVEVCHELDADFLVVGVPRLHEEESVFTHELLSHFIKDTEQKTGTTVVLPDGGGE